MGFGALHTVLTPIISSAEKNPKLVKVVAKTDLNVMFGSVFLCAQRSSNNISEFFKIVIQNKVTNMGNHH